MSVATPLMVVTQYSTVIYYSLFASYICSNSIWKCLILENDLKRGVHACQDFGSSPPGREHAHPPQTSAYPLHPGRLSAHPSLDRTAVSAAYDRCSPSKGAALTPSTEPVNWSSQKSQPGQVDDTKLSSPRRHFQVYRIIVKKCGRGATIGKQAGQG